MQKRWRCVLAALCAAVLLAACSPFAPQNIYDLLRAPALAGGQDEIQKALAAYLGGEEPHYKYPKKGPSRSPLLREDFDGDGRQEAVLLYSVPETSPAYREKGNNVYVAVLEQTDDGWTVVCDERGPDASTDVEAMEAADLLGNDTRQIIIGFATSTFNVKTFCLYTYTADVLENPYRSGYSEYETGDFTGRGGLDLVVVSPDDQLGGLSLRYIPTADGTFLVENGLEQVKLNPNFTACAGIVPSQSGDGTRLLVVDGMTGAGSLASQIVYYSGERFYTVDDSAAMEGPTARMNTLLRTRDIDGDGVAEIPLRAGQNNIQTPANDKTLCYVQWMDFLSSPQEAPLQKEFGILDADRGVYIRLPVEWRGTVGVVDGEEKGEWILQARRSMAALLSVRVIEQGESPPIGAMRMPGSVSSYLVLASGLTDAQRSLVNMTSMNAA